MNNNYVNGNRRIPFEMVWVLFLKLPSMAGSFSRSSDLSYLSLEFCAPKLSTVLNINPFNGSYLANRIIYIVFHGNNTKKIKVNTQRFGLSKIA